MQPTTKSNLSDADILRLVAVMGLDHISLLAELLQTIVEDSGFGAIEIVLANGAIQTMKLTKSYKAINRKIGV